MRNRGRARRRKTRFEIDRGKVKKRRAFLTRYEFELILALFDFVRARMRWDTGPPGTAKSLQEIESALEAAKTWHSTGVVQEHGKLRLTWESIQKIRSICEEAIGKFDGTVR